MSADAARVFVLVPGAWHGAWCWQRVIPLLESRGHRVLTPELAATGADPADAAVVTLDLWARSLAELITAQQQAVTLVGHSRGGIVISRAAELVPERLRRLVFVAAYLLPAGAQLASEARRDAGSLVTANMIPAREGVSCTLRPEIIDEAFYGDCDEETTAWARRQLTAEPLKPLVTPLEVTAARFGRVPRAYIECTRDRTITLGAQRRMQAALPCDPVLALDTGHSPFLSKPAQLAELLSRL
jgi:pimeloyl-ACP methyl ester carboxylesterase